MSSMQGYRPELPEVKDEHARVLLWVVLVILTINVLMTAYVFYVIERAVEVLQQLSQLGNQ